MRSEAGQSSSDFFNRMEYRNQRIKEPYNQYKDLDVHSDPILEGFNILYDNTGVKRRKISLQARI